ncbi:translocation/assembly module TamB domain-containing protein [Puniceibacterium sp. IMCC21224]|uniref:translocation/assembly module TamB domain-containing protein n=1 Tax=Puniceibacterium sp. IMCC21224 TaxID=1618204 RepID=UPI00064D999D|nr:translocation/assembly module TamB domain-containing protein [Puniceibacterium sp. IMCC21224]KMK66177.1 hypothetical protein IMCC21224_111024 [Puniceibacterium sp. IMCC21224]
MKRILLPVAITAVLVVGAPIVAQTEDEDRGYLQALLEDNLSGAGRDIRIKGFAGALSSQATIEELTIADDDGIWLTLREVRLDWNRAALLRGRISIAELSAQEILLPRLPTAGEDLPDPEAKPFSLPDLPVSVQIDLLEIARVTLGAPVIGIAAEVSLNGSASLAGGEGTADLTVERLDGATGTLALKGSFANETSVLAVDLSLIEGPNGLLATLTGLPDGPPLALTVKGEGPLDDFAADLGLSTEDVDRLTGRVTLAALPADAATPGRAFGARLAGDVRPLLEQEHRAFFGPDLSLTVSGDTFDDGRLVIDTLDLVSEAVRLQGNVALGPDKWPEIVALSGRLALPDGEPVLLPVPGVDTRVNGVDLNVAYNAAEGDNWTADFAVDRLVRQDLSFDTATINGSGSLTRGEGSALGALAGQFDIVADGLSPTDPAFQAALGSSLNGVIALNWTEDAPLNITNLALRGDDYALTGVMSLSGIQGDFNPTVTADVQVAAQDVSRFSDLAGRPLGGAVDVTVVADAAPLSGTFDGTVSGSARNLKTGIAQADAVLAGETVLRVDMARDTTGVVLRDFEMSSPAADITAEGVLRTGATAARFTALLRDAGLVEPSLSGPARVQGTLDQAGDTWTLAADATGPGGAVFDGRVDVPLVDGKPGRITATGSLKADALSPFSTLAGRQLGGGFDLSGTGSFELETLFFNARVTGDTRDIRTGIPEADGLLRGPGQITLDASRDDNGIMLRNLDVSTNAASITGKGVLADQDSTAEFEATLVNTAVIAPGLSGPARLTGTLTQTGNDYLLNAQGNGPGGVALSGDVTATVIDRTLGLIRGAGSLRATDLGAYAELAKRPLGGGLDITGSGSFDPTTQFFTATATGTTQDLKTGIAQADGLLTGSGRLNVDATRDADGISIRTLDVETDAAALSADGVIRDSGSVASFDAQIRDTALVVPGLTGSAQASGSLTQTGNDYTLDVTASGPGGLAFGGEIVATVEDGTPGLVRGSGEVSADSIAPYGALVNRPLRGGFDFTGSGQYHLTDQTFAVKLDGTAQNLGSGIAEADKLIAGSTTLTLDAERTEDGVLTIRTFDLANPQVSADASGRYGGADTALDFNAELGNLALFVPGFPGPVTARGSALAAGSDYRINADLTGPGGITAQVGGTVAPDASQADLGITGAAALALINPFLEPNLITGQANFDLRLNGRPGLEALSGAVTASGATFVVPAARQSLSDINARIELAGGRANLDVDAAVTNGGRVRATGPVTLSAPFNGDLAIAINQVVAADPGLFETTLDGQLTLQGSLASTARLAGAIQLGPVEVRVPSTGGGVAGSSFALRHVNEPTASRLTRERAGLIEKQAGGGAGGGGSGVNYGLDLLIQAPSRIFIRGRGLDAELGGELRLGGTIQNIEPLGRFDLVRGRLDILGQRIALSEASIVLQGNLNPEIQVVAETSRDDTTIQFVISGPVSEPEVSITSSPELPEDEVLAMLLFGRDVSEISAFQALRIAAAVNTLVGRGGNGIVDKLRMSFGVDDLDVQTAADGTTELRVGKYLTEKIYSDVTVDANGGSSINLNLQVTPNITARGSAGSDGNTGIGVFFEKDY